MNKNDIGYKKYATTANRIKSSIAVIYALIAEIIIFAYPLFAAIEEVKVEDTTLTASPKINLYIPNGVVNISIAQSISNTAINFGTKYDFLDSYINTRLGFRYSFTKVFFGADLSDEAWFEAMLIFFNKSYMQRTKSVQPYVGYKFTKSLSVRTFLGFDDTYTSSIDSGTFLDRGKNVTTGLGFLYDTTIENEILPIGHRIAFDIKHSLSELGGNYDYTQVDANITDHFDIFRNNQFIKTYLQLGYPLDIVRKPLSNIYYAGGYETLQGYALRELHGNALIYGEMSYNLHLFKVIQDKKANTSMEIVTAELIYEFAKAGEKEIFSSIYDFKSSVGMGFGINLTFFKVFNTKFDFKLFQAFEQNRSPVSYFNISTISYLKK